jgi:pimeloyl-ACP methyl ester carboxylesterase
LGLEPLVNPLVLSDGRSLDVRVSGPEDGLALVFHHGTPGTLPTRDFERAVHARGWRLVVLSRPGYGNSARQPGRTVVDIVADTTEALHSIGVDRCLIGAWSGGGPHALACAARLPGVLGAMLLAGLAPADGGLDFVAGMNQDNLDEWTAAFDGEATLRAYVEPVAPELMKLPSDEDGASADESLPTADQAAFTGEFAEDLVAATRDALRHGVDGWIDDELAFAKPWGFDLSEITIPVSLWHGSDDRNVPFSHGTWLAEHLATAVLHREDGQGHLSIMAGPFDRMLDELTRRARSRTGGS